MNFFQCQFLSGKSLHLTRWETMGGDADRRGGSVGSAGQALPPDGLLVGFLRKGEVRVFGSEELGESVRMTRGVKKG